MQEKDILQKKLILDEPRVSIIIPVYNTERFLQRCIDSLINQIYKNIEFIFVDDGSKDHSIEILYSAQKIDERIIVVEQKNAGPSAARNTGIKYASGKYILFCDSDDSVSENWCANLVNVIEQTPDSWILCGINICNENEDIVDKFVCTQGKYNKSEYYKIFRKGLSASVYNKIYRSDVLKQYKILFDEERSRGEDVIFNLEYLSHMKNILCLEVCNYNYFRYDTYQTITGRYYKDNYEVNKDLYLRRLPFICEKDLKSFRRFYWHIFWNELENTMVSAKNVNLFQRILINHSIVKDEVFQEMLGEFGPEEVDRYSFWCLERGCFVLYWGIQKLYRFIRK